MGCLKKSLALTTARVGLILAALIYSAAVAAQEFSGNIELGVRDVKTSGDRSKYKQHINLDDGFRLFNLGLRYAPDETSQSNQVIPDLVTLDAYGFGGDPYQNARLEVRHYGRYRFRYQHRKSDYFYQDLLINPEDINIESSNEGDLHHFNFERTTDSASFDLQLTDRAKLLFAYDRYKKDGDSTTVLDIQREEFELDNPVDQELSVFDIGVSYAWNRVTLTYHERWREFTNDVSISSGGASPGLDLLGSTSVDFFTLDENYGYDSREHQLGILVRPSNRWNLQFDLLKSELDMDVASFEDAQGIDFANRFFRTQDRSENESERDTTQLYFSASYAITDNLRLIGSVRDQQLDQDVTTPGTPGAESGDWRLDTNRVAVGIEANPSETWTVSGGWSRQRRDTQYSLLSAGNLAPLDETTRNSGFWLQVLHRPTTQMQWRLSIEENSIDDAFTTASATSARRYRLRGRYRWDNGLILSASHLRRDHENRRSDWQSDSQQSTLKISHSGDQLRVSLGHTWVDLDRSIAQLVRGGFRQDLFNIDYRADTKYWDVDIQWVPNERWDLMAAHRDYRNTGSFDTNRDDSRVELSVGLSERYRLYLRYRHNRFREPPGENFTANSVEFSIGYRR